jgi:hypothetical protein
MAISSCDSQRTEERDLAALANGSRFFSLRGENIIGKSSQAELRQTPSL